MSAAYLFLKTHKVGSTTGRSCWRARGDLGIAVCDGKTRRASATCGACIWHASLVPTAIALQQPRDRAAAMGAALACSMWGRVPMRTLVVLREPVLRAYARYHYEREDGWCRTRANQTRGFGCASDVLSFGAWLVTRPAQLAKRRLFRRGDMHLLAETVWVLSRATGMRGAERVLRSLTTVGVTERMDETVLAIAREWSLPLDALARHYGHANGHIRLRKNLTAAQVAWCYHVSPALNRELALYATRTSA